MSSFLMPSLVHRNFYNFICENRSLTIMCVCVCVCAKVPWMNKWLMILADNFEQIIHLQDYLGTMATEKKMAMNMSNGLIHFSTQVISGRENPNLLWKLLIFTLFSEGNHIILKSLINTFKMLWFSNLDVIEQTLESSGWMYFGGARGVMVIVVRNGHSDTSSNPGQDWLHFT